MPIQTSNPVSIAGNSISDVSVSLILNAKLGGPTIGASAVLNVQPYITEGTSTLAVGPVRSLTIPDVYAEAAKNPALAAQVQIITDALAAIVLLQKI